MPQGPNQQQGKPEGSVVRRETEGQAIDSSCAAGVTLGKLTIPNAPQHVRELAATGGDVCSISAEDTVLNDPRKASQYLANMQRFVREFPDAENPLGVRRTDPQNSSPVSVAERRREFGAIFDPENQKRPDESASRRPAVAPTPAGRESIKGTEGRGNFGSSITPEMRRQMAEESRGSGEPTAQRSIPSELSNLAPTAQLGSPLNRPGQSSQAEQVAADRESLKKLGLSEKDFVAVLKPLLDGRPGGQLDFSGATANFRRDIVNPRQYLNPLPVNQRAEGDLPAAGEVVTISRTINGKETTAKFTAIDVQNIEKRGVFFLPPQELATLLNLRGSGK